MTARLRIILVALALALLAIFFGIYKWSNTKRSTPAAYETRAVRAVNVAHIERGKYKFEVDIHTSERKRSASHALLFVRKRDGSLHGLFMPYASANGQYAALPTGDGLTPGTICTRLDIVVARERITCWIEGADGRGETHTWNLEGRATSRGTSNLRRIGGAEKDGVFSFFDQEGGRQATGLPDPNP